MSFRDDPDALRSYHDQLARDLAALDVRARELGAVEAERTRITSELARVGAALDHHAARRAPIRLDNLRVAAPCDQPWETMVGDDRVRDCGRCKHPVWNLSEMTRDEAEDLLATRGTSACVQFYRRADGTVMTSDCADGVRRRRSRLALAAGVLAGAAGVAAVAAARIPATDAVEAGAIARVELAEEYRPGARVVQNEPAPPPPSLEVQLDLPVLREAIRGRVSYVPTVTPGELSVVRVISESTK